MMKVAIETNKSRFVMVEIADDLHFCHYKKDLKSCDHIDEKTGYCSIYETKNYKPKMSFLKCPTCIFNISKHAYA